MIEKRIIKIIIFSILVGFGLSLIFFFLFDVATALNVIIFVLIGTALILFYSLWENEKKIKEMERTFPIFLINLRKNIEAGVPTAKAFIAAAEQNYGNLTKYFRTFAKKIKLGVPITEALEYLKKNFSASRKLVNSINILSQTVRSGYGMSSTIYSVSEYILKILEVEDEKRGVLNQFTLIFYAVTVILGVIILTMIKILIPILSEIPGFFADPCQTPVGFEIAICELFKSISYLFKSTIPQTYYMFGILSLVTLLQAIFGGIIIGIGVENSLIKGFIHSLILFSLIFFMFLVSARIGLI